MDAAAVDRTVAVDDWVGKTGSVDIVARLRGDLCGRLGRSGSGS